MKINLYLLISALCMNTAWAAWPPPATSANMAPGGDNSGVYTTYAPQTVSWIRVVDQSSTCKWASQTYSDKSGEKYMSLYFDTRQNTAPKRSREQTNISCPDGWVATDIKSSYWYDGGSSGVSELALYTNVYCCPLKWVQINTSNPGDSNATQTPSNP